MFQSITNGLIRLLLTRPLHLANENYPNHENKLHLIVFVTPCPYFHISYCITSNQDPICTFSSDKIWSNPVILQRQFKTFLISFDTQYKYQHVRPRYKNIYPKTLAFLALLFLTEGRTLLVDFIPPKNLRQEPQYKLFGSYWCC